MVILAITFLISVNSNFQLIINGFTEVFSDETVLISKQTKILFEKLFFMCMTYAFYYFADFGHKQKNKKKINQMSVSYLVVNQSYINKSHDLSTLI